MIARGWGLALLLPSLAAMAASERNDYAQQWPLRLSEPAAGAYRVVLDEAVYRRVQRASLADIEVFNAQGQSVPAALVNADVPLAGARLQPLPWFPLPAMATSAGNDLQAVTERDADGSVRRVDIRVQGGRAAPMQGWLVDASGVHEPIEGLALEWRADVPVQAQLRIEGSDDLRQWHLLDPQATVVDLANRGNALRQRRIPLQSRARYLRLTPLSPGFPQLDGVTAELAPAQVPMQWLWLELAGSAREGGFDFASSGRFPVSRIDVQVDGNTAVEWTLLSRDDADAPWRQRAGPWLAWQVDGAGRRDRSLPQMLSGAVRDRYWRLQPRQAAAGPPPRLRLGYRAETLVFLAQGDPPYALAAGSARAERGDAPLAQTLQALREQRGAQWRPAVATLSAAPQILAGDAALQPQAAPRDWKSWLLWALLVAGALAVAGFALSLLRRPTDQGPPA
ncbi:DUF3999 domain-containing protein [Stenotrophomonas sp. MMGLT7]|uniref:DUF3999 domain-containing protein n=1 Tax=Stenotrophomonas sp. MMGLT7 TaxID=2901227 RepID=UPI001E310128|nr:DUF3999 domain-containing protein [Stenotrophomonas sp. MMGLT7]MCD7097587.1 DUF3999 domain-containing protein [Stenotrophomonas sp. MMGLT7]